MQKNGIKIVTAFILFLIALAACESLPKSTPTNSSTPAPTRTNIATAPPISTLRLTPLPKTPIVVRTSPTPTEVSICPPFLGEVRPLPDSIISLAQFTEFIPTDITFEGPPPPSVDYIGYRSSVCTHVNVDTLAEPGDLFETNEDVFDQVEMAVDGKILEEMANTDYVVHIELDLICHCYFDCDEWEYPNWFNEPMPENTACWYGLGFWGCYPVELEPGIHNATFRFNQTSGTIQAYDWVFGITD